MRYRPLGKSGMAVSTVTLRVRGEICAGDPEHWVGVIHAAFEQGINSFELVNPTEALLQGFALASQAVERRLIFVAYRLPQGAGPDEVFRDVEQVIAATGLKFLDLVVADADGELHNDTTWMLEDL